MWRWGCWEGRFFTQRREVEKTQRSEDAFDLVRVLLAIFWRASRAKILLFASFLLCVFA
jgi:hypothetical protein